MSALERYREERAKLAEQERQEWLKNHYEGLFQREDEARRVAWRHAAFWASVAGMTTGVLVGQAMGALAQMLFERLW